MDTAERNDALWRLLVYRRSRYAMHLGWSDVAHLDRARLGRPIAGQLWRALGSIAANLAEGFGRGTGPDRARFVEYALGSTRECVVWYQAARAMLPAGTADDRLANLVEIRRMSLALLPRMRVKGVRDG